jgi:hypothetical protein
MASKQKLESNACGAFMSQRQVDVITALQQLVSTRRRHYLAQIMLQVLAGILFVVGVLSITLINAIQTWLQTLSTASILLGVMLGLALLIGLSILILWQAQRRQGYQKISAENVLWHLNVHYPKLQQSAHLALQDEQQLALLQRLQKQQILPQLLTAVDEQQQLFQGPSNLLHLHKVAIYNHVFVILGLVLIWGFLTFSTTQVTEQAGLNSLPNAIEQEPNPSLLKAKLTITPPAYTQTVVKHEESMNISLLSGSSVSWQLDFSSAFQPNETLYLALSSGQRINLTAQTNPNDTTRLTASAVVEQSAIYYLASDQQRFDGIYSLSVNVDQPPHIRFVQPTKTISEFASDVLPELETEVWIEDDFVLSKVHILASVAKGSGEAVKFRDEIVEFDRHEIRAGKAHYFKHWDLKALGMEPGDELYFSVWAWDNREPESQLTRSPSKIIRWLDTSSDELVSAGLMLDILPEYFKSQRQIIIETEQLIADAHHLDTEQFTQTSRALGFAQSELKRKYGQFLGDEFAALVPHNMESGPDVSSHANDHAEDAEHEHEAAEKPDKPASYESIIEQYGHNHGEAEAGLVNKTGVPTPTALMKQAIANMWSAEMHLMLAQPDLALPFEQQALNYLNQAKQAERIYVKRLGFEPPPVSETRRYQGDLSDIVSLERATQVTKDEQIQRVATALNQIKHWQRQDGQQPLALTDVDIAAIKDRLITTYASEQNVRYLASLEQLQIDAKQLQQLCRECLDDLLLAVWQTLPAPVAMPLSQQHSYWLKDPVIEAYQQFLQQAARP